MCCVVGVANLLCNVISGVANLQWSYSLAIDGNIVVLNCKFTASAYGNATAEESVVERSWKRSVTRHGSNLSVTSGETDESGVCNAISDAWNVWLRQYCNQLS